MWPDINWPAILPPAIVDLIVAATGETLLMVAVAASLATLVGLPLGIFLAALVTNALGQYDLRFELPLGQLIVLVVVSVLAGLLAAITPARRAAKLNPLEALQYE